MEHRFASNLDIDYTKMIMRVDNNNKKKTFCLDKQNAYFVKSKIIKFLS